MKVLDLFCGAGGAAVGLQKAGFLKIHGMDKKLQKDYPFHFIQYDVTKLSVQDLQAYQLIWASPPCQAYSVGTVGHRNRGKIYPDLVGYTRALLKAAKKPYVIENVPGAPIRRDLMLCGQMFGLPIIRHRWFEIEGFYVPQPPHIEHLDAVHNGSAVMAYSGGRAGNWGKRPRTTRPPSLKRLQEALEVPWITTKKMIFEAVPPKYSQYIGHFFLHPFIRPLFPVERGLE